MMLISQNLKAFMIVAKNGSIHQSTTELGLTQTGITQRIKALEDEIKCSLFLRSRKGMRLTPEGEVLLRYSERIQDVVGELSSQLSNNPNREVSLTLAGPTSIMGSRIVSQCSPFVHTNTSVYLNFLINDHLNRVDLVKSGVADLAIVSPDQVPNELDSKKLKPDRYLLVAPSKWKNRKISDILSRERMIDFEDRDPTTRKYLHEFDLTKLVKRGRLFSNSNDALIRMICNEWGYGTLTQEVAAPYLASGELIALNSGKMLNDPLALTWYPRKSMPLYLESIIQAIS